MEEFNSIDISSSGITYVSWYSSASAISYMLRDSATHSVTLICRWTDHMLVIV